MIQQPQGQPRPEPYIFLNQPAADAEPAVQENIEEVKTEEKKVGKKPRGRPPKNRQRKKQETVEPAETVENKDELKKLEPGYYYQIDSQTLEKRPMETAAPI